MLVRWVKLAASRVYLISPSRSGDVKYQFYSGSPEATAFEHNRLPPWSVIWLPQTSDQARILGTRLRLVFRRQLQDLILDGVNHELHLVVDVKLSHEVGLVCIHSLDA